MKTTWTHKKYGKRQYKGHYYYHGPQNEREFVLSCMLKTGKMHNVTFESWKMAKDMGWVKK